MNSSKEIIGIVTKFIKQKKYELGVNSILNNYK